MGGELAARASGAPGDAPRPAAGAPQARQAPQAPQGSQGPQGPQGHPAPPPRAAGDGACGELVEREFFARPGPQVAPELLGCVLEHETPDGLVAVRLTEVEAYAGELDPASHAWRGKTARTAVMFGPPGHAYVYFTYGMHFCVNLVCLPEGTASAVLLRAGEVIAGAGIAAARRSARPGTAPNAAPTGPGLVTGIGTTGNSRPSAVRDLARGPARLCQALGIDRALDGADACDPQSPLRIRARTGPAGGRIASGPRTGVSRAADTPWRFWLEGDPTVSPYRPHVPRRR